MDSDITSFVRGRLEDEVGLDVSTFILCVMKCNLEVDDITSNLKD